MSDVSYLRESEKARCPKVLLSDEMNLAFHLRIKVPEAWGRVDKMGEWRSLEPWHLLLSVHCALSAPTSVLPFLGGMLISFCPAELGSCSHHQNYKYVLWSPKQVLDCPSNLSNVFMETSLYQVLNTYSTVHGDDSKQTNIFFKLFFYWSHSVFNCWETEFGFSSRFYQ